MPWRHPGRQAAGCKGLAEHKHPGQHSLPAVDEVPVDEVPV